MEDKELYIEEMNKFLKGVHMGSTTFKDYVEKAESIDVKVILLEIIDSFKKHEKIITESIEELNGIATKT